MIEHWLIALTQLCMTYSNRMTVGPPLQEHEACCYMSICRLLEENARRIIDNNNKETANGDD